MGLEGTLRVSAVRVVLVQVTFSSGETAYDLKVPPDAVLIVEPGGDVMLPVRPELQLKKVVAMRLAPVKRRSGHTDNGLPASTASRLGSAHTRSAKTDTKMRSHRPA